MTQLQAVLLSLAVELPVLLGVARLRRWAVPRDRLLIVGAAATLLTHPAVWHGTRALRPVVANWWARAAITEVGAVLAEAALFVVLLGVSRRSALGASALANAASFGVGLVWFLGIRPAWSERAAVCPPGTAADPSRAAAIAHHVGAAPDDGWCFGPRPGALGVRDGAGRLLLDAAADDRLLAARVVHLERHQLDAAVGPGCEPALRREEAAAWAAELAVRRRLGVEDPSCPLVGAAGPAATIDDAERWLRTGDPVATELRAVHRARCRPEPTVE